MKRKPHNCKGGGRDCPVCGRRLYSRDVYSFWFPDGRVVHEERTCSRCSIAYLGPIIVTTTGELWRDEYPRNVWTGVEGRYEGMVRATVYSEPKRLSPALSS